MADTTKHKNKRDLTAFAGSILVALSLFVLAAGLCGGCGENRGSSKNNAEQSKKASARTDSASDSNAKKSNKAKTGARRERVTSVNCAEVVRSDLVIPIIAEGTVRARHSAEIRTEIEGRIENIYVEEGRHVKKGQLLAKIDAREYEAAVEEARAQYLQALSRLAVEEDTLNVEQLPPRLKKKFAALEKMEKQGEITHEEKMAREITLDVEALREGCYRVDVAAARSGVASARSALERARLNLERTELTAPFSGVVSGLTFSRGQQVTKGELFCNLIDKEDVEARIGVLEADLGNLAENQPALLIFPSLGDTIRAKVDVISPSFDRDARTCEVLLRFRCKDGHVRPGMFVRAVIAGRRYPNRLQVPNEAILTRDGRPLLFKAENDRAKWLYVKLGERNDQMVEIKRVLQGGTLSPGDLVIVSDHLTLAHDAKIRVRKIIPTSDPWRSTNKDG